MTNSPLKAWLERDKQVLRLQLARPKANIIDARMIDALSAALDAHVNNKISVLAPVSRSTCQTSVRRCSGN